MRYTLHLTLTDDRWRAALQEFDNGGRLADRFTAQIPELAGLDLDVQLSSHNVLDPQHMANLGGQLFTRYLISVEATGALLLVALVGAVAIVVQGRQPDGRQ